MENENKPREIVGYRLVIEAVALTQAGAASQALSLIGSMMVSPHGLGHSNGGTNGNASGRWEAIER